ncbi:MAG: hypothetical protein ACYDG2_05810 [Ruminiclostridium sp.]
MNNNEIINYYALTRDLKKNLKNYYIDVPDDFVEKVLSDCFVFEIKEDTNHKKTEWKFIVEGRKGSYYQVNCRNIIFQPTKYLNHILKSISIKRALEHQDMLVAFFLIIQFLFSSLCIRLSDLDAIVYSTLIKINKAVDSENEIYGKVEEFAKQCNYKVPDKSEIQKSISSLLKHHCIEEIDGKIIVIEKCWFDLSQNKNSASSIK